LRQGSPSKLVIVMRLKFLKLRGLLTCEAMK